MVERRRCRGPVGISDRDWRTRAAIAARSDIPTSGGAALVDDNNWQVRCALGSKQYSGPAVWRAIADAPGTDIRVVFAQNAWVPLDISRALMRADPVTNVRENRLLRASRTTVGYCVRPARRSATACVPHEVGYCARPARRSSWTAACACGLPSVRVSSRPSSAVTPPCDGIHLVRRHFVGTRLRPWRSGWPGIRSPMSDACCSALSRLRGCAGVSTIRPGSWRRRRSATGDY